MVRNQEGAEFGPFTSAELHELVRLDRLGPGDFVRREVGRTWSPFEKISGLGDSSGVEGISEQAAEEVVVPISQPASPIPPAAIVDSAPAESGEAFSRGDTPPLMKDARDNPFHPIGVLIDRLPDEELLFVLRQTFLDSLRSSILATILGRRGTMVCTNRRVVVVAPTITSTSVQMAYLDRVGLIARTSKTSIWRIVLGVILLIWAASMFFPAFFLGGTGAAVGIIGAMFGWFMGAIFALAGLSFVLTATSRVLMVEAGEALVFVSSAASPWHLGQIDTARTDQAQWR